MKKMFHVVLFVLLGFLIVGCANKNEEPSEDDGIVVKFDTNGGSPVASIKLEQSDLIQAPLFPQKDGYVFRGWYEDKELTKPFDFELDYVTSKKTLYAKWVEQYRMTDESFKILMIGNSYSRDAATFLWSIAESAGFDPGNIHVVNMWIGAQTFDKHAIATVSGQGYLREIYTGPTKTELNGIKLSEAISYDDWDVITFQQGPAHSGLIEKYENHMETLTNWALQNALNPNVKIGFYLTWAHHKDSTQSYFPSYDNDQMKMYKMTVNAFIKKILPVSGVSFVVPVGTAIQNGRTSYFGDAFTIDGYHLNDHGKYVAGLAFFKAITGMSLDKVTFVPDSLTEEQAKIAKEAVNAAIINPLGITESNYKTK